MRQRSNRRRFLATVGAGTALLAGCADLGGDDEDTDDADDDVASNGAEADDADDDTDTDDEEETPEEEEEDVTPPAIGHGELLDDFEDPDGWAMLAGEFEGDSDEALTGSQSLRVQSEEGRAGVLQAFGDLDMEGQDLSFALKIETPRPTHVVVQVLAPFESDMLTCRRRVVEQFEGWQRVDVGFTGIRGEPDLSDVEEIRIYVEGEEEEPTRFWIDDLRLTEGADQGYVMLTFDDTVESQYENAFPIMQEREMRGVLAVVPPSINVSGRLTIDQLREMRDAGWDVSAHTERSDPLTEMDPEEAQAELEADHEYLAGRGFEDGSRAQFVPYHYANQEVVDIIREFYEFSSYFGGCNNAMPPTDPHSTSRAGMYDLDGFTQLIDMAAATNQLAVGYVHGVGDDEDFDDLTEDEFEDLLDYIEDADVEVVTVSDILDENY
ncbi:polysaccharide deacetylase family protein [Natronorarus salvus]|uniref:polysaccharide deacetylase family protein n=1 Tax=Natronorarus salvus TaxID=3117733 RepID=UPI002F267BA9